MKKFFARFKKKVGPRPYELYWTTKSGLSYRLAGSSSWCALLDWAVSDVRLTWKTAELAPRVTWVWRAGRFIGIVDGTDSYYEVTRIPR